MRKKTTVIENQPETDAEVDIHIWKKFENENMVDLYTISRCKRSICFDMPIDEAMECLREYLEELRPNT